MQDFHHLSRIAVALLSRLIAVPSLSREESQTADIIETFLKEQGCQPFRKGNNVWVRSFIDARLPVILLNSHHDTVKPVSSWTRNPFEPLIKDGKLYGLGSNDAGASLVSLMMTFLHYKDRQDRPYNLIYAATAEEEITGKGGISLIMDDLGQPDLVIVGEPTQMQMAIAEKGLMVLDCETQGKTGHAARNEGVNAIYPALDDIQWFRTFKFPLVSPVLGEVKMTVSVIHAGYQHNIVPDKCTYVVDVRTNEHYKNTEVLEIIRQHVRYSSVTPRSTHINSSSIPVAHPVIQKGLSMGLGTYGSPTTSDQARIPYTSFKIGPGDSARSHTADEFVYPDEIEKGIAMYIKLLDGLQISKFQDDRTP
ncbi:MAG: M20 family metallo-hydrolase [Bacteroidales bacterium]|jgi:acetylornithine deacetylase|nr:M20 family metallo-hydrolase [Bacteroidales bacterium]